MPMIHNLFITILYRSSKEKPADGCGIKHVEVEELGWKQPRPSLVSEKE